LENKEEVDKFQYQVIFFKNIDRHLLVPKNPQVEILCGILALLVNLIQQRAIRKLCELQSYTVSLSLKLSLRL
jgi:GTPase Era involved in 16S rRNA processing